MKRGVSAVATLLACLVILAWTPSSYRTVVWISSTADGLEFTVNGKQLGDERLENVTLDHAIDDNPNMRIADIYEDALIILCADVGVALHEIKEVEERLVIEGFGNLRVGRESDCGEA